MKIHVSGDTPMERLTNLTKRLLQVPRAELNRKAAAYERKKQQRRRMAAKAR